MSSRMRQGMEVIKYAMAEIWRMDVLGEDINNSSLSKVLNRGYEYVAQKEGKYHNKISIDKTSVSSKLIIQVFDSAKALENALINYYETDGKDRTLEVEMLNNVSRASKVSPIIDTEYLRQEFAELRTLYGLRG